MVLKQHIDDEFSALNKDNLRREVNILKQLYHPGIVQVFPLTKANNRMSYHLLHKDVHS